MWGLLQMDGKALVLLVFQHESAERAGHGEGASRKHGGDTLPLLGIVQTFASVLNNSDFSEGFTSIFGVELLKIHV